MKTGFITLRVNHGARKPPNLLVPVEIIGDRKHADRLLYLITPVGGSGEAWVDRNRITDIKEYQQSASKYDYIDNGGKAE